MKFIIAVLIFHVFGVMLRPLYERRFPKVFDFVKRIKNNLRPN